jgi:hypothetical protein
MDTETSCSTYGVLQCDVMFLEEMFLHCATCMNWYLSLAGDRGEMKGCAHSAAHFLAGGAKVGYDKATQAQGVFDVAAPV